MKKGKEGKERGIGAYSNQNSLREFCRIYSRKTED
jgi:hypothetical protein